MASGQATCKYPPGKHPNSMANLRMFEPGHPVDHENVAAAGRAGGAAKRRNRLLRDALRVILDAPPSGAVPNEEEIIALLTAMGVEEPTNADAVALATVRKAILGDVEAARFVRDSSGERPSQAIEVGNLGDRPFESLNLKELSDEQLKELASARMPDAGTNE